MRTGCLVLFVLAAATATAAAHPTSLPPGPVPGQNDFAIERSSTRIALPSSDSFFFRHARSDDSEVPLLGTSHIPDAAPQSSGPSINIGSFHAEIGGTGTHAHLAHYTLQGVQVMGGTVSGSIDGRSARIAIDW
jgi:hypothetical protein